MKVWILWIKNTTTETKWIDSIWASEDHLKDRVDALTESMNRSGGAGNYTLFFWEATVADAAVAAVAEVPANAE